MKVYDDYLFKDLASKLKGEGYRIYAPVKVKDYFLFREVEPEEIELSGYTNTLKPVKEIIFPQNEVLIRYGEWIEEVPSDEEKRVVIGVRPCDAKGVALLDKVFLDDIVDPYYKQRRENTLLIGLACSEACEYGFCTSFNIDGEGLDIITYPIAGGYAIEAKTQRGEEVLKLINARDADENAVRQVEELKSKFAASAKRKIDAKRVAEIMPELFDSDYWKEVAMNCVSCGACTYLCPTCYCFDILDEGEISGIRYRCWDSCQFPLYTLESSSHNPRRERFERLRNRFYDKFLYMLRRKGEFYCVGCGRCIEKCPVGIDIVEVLNGLLEVRS